MKILIVTDAWHPQINGVVRTYEHIIEGLEKRDHNVLVISPADFTYTMPMPGYPEIRLTLMPYRGLQSKIKAFNPDSIHIATEGPLGWAARRFCISRKLKFSTSYHTHFPDYVAKRVLNKAPFMKKALSKLAFSLARTRVRRFHAPSNALMVTTKSVAKTLKEWGFKPKIYTLTRGVETSQYFPLAKDAQRTLMKNIKTPIALYVGRVAIEKNIEAFLDAQWDGSKIIVGHGPALNTLKRKYKDAHFVGSQTGSVLAQYYRESDIFVFPSKTDTFGIVLIEALASGLPVAAYPVSGPIDIVTKDFLGALDKDLSVAMKRAYALSEDTDTAQKRAYFVQKYYSWTKATEQFETAQIAIEKP